MVVFLADVCFRENSFEDRRDAAVLLATGIRGIGAGRDPPCRDDLNRGDVDLEYRESKVRGKGGQDRAVKISHEAARRLNRYLRTKSRMSLEREPPTGGAAGRGVRHAAVSECRDKGTSLARGCTEPECLCTATVPRRSYLGRK